VNSTGTVIGGPGRCSSYRRSSGALRAVGALVVIAISRAAVAKEERATNAARIAIATHFPLREVPSFLIE
jgi:hypothetical protein